MFTACHTKNGSQGGDSRSKQINALFERYINDAEPNETATPEASPKKTDTIPTSKPKPAQPKQVAVVEEPVEPVVVEEPDTVADTPDTIAEIEEDTIIPQRDTIDPLKAGVATSFTPDSCEADLEIAPLAKKLPVVALRTNLLYDALVVPNIGLEVALPMHFTIAFDWIATWIKSDNKHLYWQGYGGYLTLRYYFGKAANEYPFIGHHVGIYGDLLTYDVEFGGQGYQAWKPGFGGGVEYGYSLPVKPYLCIDFNIGVGYQGGQYEVYQPANDGTGHYVWQATRKRRWFGPTKAEISLKWMISPVEKKKKGGQS